MDELSLTSLERLIEQIQELLDQVIQIRVIIARNTIDIYTLFEHIHVALVQAANNDPHFVDITIDASENEPGDSTIETLVREIDELVIEYEEFI